MKRIFIVTLEAPKKLTSKELTNYILDALETWKGQLDPDDDLFDLDADKMFVKEIK